MLVEGAGHQLQSIQLNLHSIRSGQKPIPGSDALEPFVQCDDGSVAFAISSDPSDQFVCLVVTAGQLGSGWATH